MINPLISIGITCYRSKDTIVNSINSAINQNWENKEIIIVDDFSNDGTVDLIKKIDFKNTTYKLIQHRSNKGFPSSINSLIRHAKGQFLCFFDHDDISDPERLNIQFSTLKKYIEKTGAKHVVCYASRIRLYENGYKKIMPAIGSQEKIPIGNDIINYHLSKRVAQNIYFGSGTPSCSLFAPTYLFKLIGDCDINLKRTVDCEIAIKLGEIGCHFVGCADVLVTQLNTLSIHKTGLSNMESDYLLFNKFSKYLDKSSLKFLKGWSTVKGYYLSGLYFKGLIKLVFLIIQFPLRSFLKIIKTGPSRIKHDIKINK